MTISEYPPTLVFDVDWANAEEKRDILEQMVRLERQTMNLRIMPGARLIRIRAVEDDNRVVGWAGCDPVAGPDGLGEVFSLYVIPEYRMYTVGTLLETARAAFLKSAGVKRVLTRMESGSNTPLLRYRMGARLVVEAALEELPVHTHETCRQCELFGKQCTEQAYLFVDLDALLARGKARFGDTIPSWTLPMRAAIDPRRIRKSVRPPSFSVRSASVPAPDQTSKPRRSSAPPPSNAE